MFQTIRNAALIGGTALLTSPVFAAADVSAITEAKTDALAVAAALVGLSIAVWGALYIRRMFGGK